MRNRIWFIAIVAGTLGVIATIVVIMSRAKQKATDEMTRLLAGDDRITLQSIQVDDGQPCTDPEVLRYVAAAFRRSSSEIDYDGHQHQATFVFADGAVYRTPIWTWSHWGLSLSLRGKAAEEGFPSNGLYFPQPVPEDVKRLFHLVKQMDTMRAPGVTTRRYGPEPPQ